MSEWNADTAEWYAKNYGEYATNKLGIDALDLAADATVVDIGCGTGSALRHASERVRRGRLIGIDPVPRMVQIAREHTAGHASETRIEYLDGGAEELPIADAIADVVLAFDSFDHWQDATKGLAEVRRVLKADGCFVVIKDGGLPSGAAGNKAFLAALAAVDFEIMQESKVEQGDVVLRSGYARLCEYRC